MRKDYKPKWSPITEVPVIPVHEDLGGRDAPSQHPIEAIDGLAEALAGKVDADVTKQLSTEDYTSAEKAKLAGIAVGAEANVINAVKVGGVELLPDGDRAVDITLPVEPQSITYDGGVIAIGDGNGGVIASTDTGLGDALVSAEWDDGEHALLFSASDGGTVTVGIPSYEAGAEANIIEGIEYDGTTAVPDADRVVTLDVYSTEHSIAQASLDAATGTISLKNASGTTLATLGTPLGTIITAAAYDTANRRLVLSKADGTAFYVPLQMIITPYTGSDSVSLSEAQDGQIQIAVAPSVLASLDNTVRLTGSQLIAGAKNFTGVLASSGETAGLTLQSAKGSSDTGQATGIYHYLTGAGGYVLTAYDDIYLQASRIIKRMRLTGRDNTIQTLALIANDDGTAYVTAPSYLPSDGQGGTAAPSDGKTVITQDMLAASPTVMHTTGDETIAGTKTFSGDVVSTGSTAKLALKSSKTSASTGQATIISHHLSSDGGDVVTAYDDIYLQASRIIKRMRLTGRDSSTYTIGLIANDDGTGYAMATSYLPSDGQGGVAAPSDGTAIITQDMLAASPTVVHRAGDETVAGTKTFSSLPVIPTTAPTSDGQAASKKYVDDSVADFWHAGQGLGTGTEVATGRNVFYIDDPTYLKITNAVQTSGDQSIAGDKAFTGGVAFSGPVTESGSISSKSVVTPSVQTVEDTAYGWYKVYEISVTTNVTHTLVLWSSPTSPVVGASYPMGILMASIRGSSCVLKWHSGMAAAVEADLQKTALVCTQTGEGAYTWALWQKADGASIGRYLHRLAEYTMNGPSSGWTALAPSASDAQASLPSGEGITVHYSEA